MATFKPCMLLKKRLNDLPIIKGQFIVTIDTGELFVDVNSYQRKQMFNLQNLT